MDIFFSMFLILVLLCALTDFLTFKIPNELVGTIFILFFIAVFAKNGVSFTVIKDPLITFVIVLVITFGLYSFKLMGAGDAKLISMTCLWLSHYGNVLLFLVLMGVCGAILGFIYMKFNTQINKVRLSWIHAMPDKSWFTRFVQAKTDPKISVNPPVSGNMNEKKSDANEVVKIPYAVAIFIGLVISLKFV